MPKQRSTHGFTLIELAIVLIIIGLLVGGVLIGRSLIHAAELRQIPRQFAQFATAVNSFRGKYFALPGDLANASQFWGFGGTDCGSGNGTIPPATCNGNNDKFVRSIYSPGDTTSGITAGNIGENESGLMWQHLANAGLIEGKYDGQVIFPEVGKFASSSWLASDVIGNVGGRNNIFNGSYHNFLQANIDLLPEDVWSLDTKMDDALPGKGKFLAYMGAGTTPLSECTTSASTPHGANIHVDYRPASTRKSCGFIINNAF